MLVEFGRETNGVLTVIRTGPKLTEYGRLSEALSVVPNGLMFLEQLVVLDHAPPKGIFILLSKKRQNSILEVFFVMTWFCPKT